MANPIRIKAGGTLLIEGVITQDDGTPFDLTSVQITSQLNDISGTRVATLTTTTTDAAGGVFTLSCASSDTASLAPGQYSADICYLQAGSVLYSDTFVVAVSGAITPPPSGAL